jgi:hypothetical protein
MNLEPAPWNIISFAGWTLCTLPNLRGNKYYITLQQQRRGPSDRAHSLFA